MAKKAKTAYEVLLGRSQPKNSCKAFLLCTNKATTTLPPSPIFVEFYPPNGEVPCCERCKKKMAAIAAMSRR